MISLRSRNESMQERYSRASLCAGSERSVESDEADRMDMTIEVEVCSTFYQPRCPCKGILHTTVLPYCFLLFTWFGGIFFETAELILI